MTRDDALAINGERLWDSLMEMAKIGATEKGGCCRLALTDLDRQARDLFVSWCREAGCTISVDQIVRPVAQYPLIRWEIFLPVATALTHSYRRLRSAVTLIPSRQGVVLTGFTVF